MFLAKIMKAHEVPIQSCFAFVQFVTPWTVVVSRALHVTNVPSDLSMSGSPYHSHDRYDGTLNRVDVEKERHRAGTIGCSGRNRTL